MYNIFSSIESKTLPLIICFQSFHIFPCFCSAKSGPRQLAAFVLSPLPPAVLPAPLEAPAAPAMQVHFKILQDTSGITCINWYWQSIGDLPVLFFCIYWPALQYRYFPCAIFFLSMIFPNSAWEGLTADPIMFLTSWRPGQVAGWFMQRKDTTICW